MAQTQVEQILAGAIGREIEARDFYRQVAERAGNSTVKETFQQLAQEEAGHQELLESCRADPAKLLKIQAPAVDYKVAEITELPAFALDMKPADAIALAMKKEQQAVEFYRQMEANAADSGVKAMFANLANMELGHKHRLENVFVEIGYPEVF